jgi:hypothetical protein
MQIKTTIRHHHGGEMTQTLYAHMNKRKKKDIITPTEWLKWKRLMTLHVGEDAEQPNAHPLVMRVQMV